MQPSGGFGRGGRPLGQAPHLAIHDTRFAAPAGPVPETVALVPKDRQLVETFGFACGSVCVGSLIGSVGLAYDFAKGHMAGASFAKWIAAAVVLILVCGAIELLRRSRRVVLVRHDDEGLGVYRRGRLDLDVTMPAVQFYKLHPINTAKLLGSTGFFAVAATIGVFGNINEIVTTGKLSPWFFWSLGLAIASGGSCVSTIWERTQCFHYNVPRPNGSVEEVVLSKADLRRTGWPLP